MDNNFEPHRSALSGLIRNFDSFRALVEEIGARIVSSEVAENGEDVNVVTCKEASLDNCSRCIYRRECEAPINS